MQAYMYANDCSRRAYVLNSFHRAYHMCCYSGCGQRVHLISSTAFCRLAAAVTALTAVLIRRPVKGQLRGVPLLRHVCDSAAVFGTFCDLTNLAFPYEAQPHSQVTAAASAASQFAPVAPPAAPSSASRMRSRASVIRLFRMATVSRQRWKEVARSVQESAPRGVMTLKYNDRR